MAAFCRHSRPLYRHSRVSGNPERYCLMMVLSTGNRGIPAYAGMTVERRPAGRSLAVPFGIPAYAGMTVGAAGFPFAREGR